MQAGLGDVVPDCRVEPWVGVVDSGGQQQRVAIARALVSDPRILICDEPTGDLDRKTADEVLTLLQRLNSDFGKTIVMVTHDPKAAEYARRIVHLDKGTLVKEESRG